MTMPRTIPNSVGICSRHACVALCCLWLGTVPASGPAWSAPALVHAGPEQGQALLFHHRNLCFALTAHHVVQGEDFIELLVPGSRDRIALASRAAEMPGDLALLSVSRLPVSHCGRSLETLSDVVTGMIERTSRGREARLPKVWESGALDFELVRIARLDAFYIELTSGEAGVIERGDSGTALMLDEAPIGILLDAGNEQLRSRALRMDVALWMLERVLGREAIPAVPAASPGTLGDLASAPSDGARIAEIGVRTHPESPGRPASMLTPNPDDGPWIGIAEVFPVDIVIDLGGDALRDLKRIRLSAPEDAPIDRLPRDVELAYSPARSPGDFIPIGNGLMSPLERVLIFDELAVRARHVRLRVRSGWGRGRPEFAIDSISVEAR